MALCTYTYVQKKLETHCQKADKIVPLISGEPLSSITDIPFKWNKDLGWV
jgi:hypothetical protein